MNAEQNSKEKQQLSNDQINAQEALPKQRPRLRSILKVQNDSDALKNKQKQRKTVKFAEQQAQIYKVASYKKYNSFVETNKKKCCNCTIF